MIEDVALSAAETKGLRIGDEVHLVTACCQLNAEFSGDDAAAAVSGIAGDADLHGLYPFAFLK